MRGYKEDEYEEYDDYEEDGEEQLEDADDEQEEEEEEPKPTKEELEYLELRQKLKEAIREQRKNEGSLASSDKKTLPYDNFGSFFGPSKPVIAPRVIQESKSFLENQNLASRILQSQVKNNKSSSSTSAGSRSEVTVKAPRVNNAFKQKVQKLKDTRDYSFLLSEDAELPAPAKQPPTRNLPTPTSEARPAKLPLPSKQTLGSNGRHAQNVHDDWRPASTNGQTNPKASSNKFSSIGKPNSTLAANRRPHGGNKGSGPGRPAMPNGSQQGPGRPAVPNGSLQGPGRPAMSNGSLQGSGRPAMSNGSRQGSGQPAMSNGSLQKKPVPSSGKSSSQVRNPMQAIPKAPVAKVQPSISKHQVEQRRDVRDSTKPKITTKPPTTSMKPPTNKPMKQISSRATSQDQKPKRKPIRQFSDDEDDDGETAIKMIRKMFRYNPKKFADRDDDLSDMETNYDEIMKEEQRSARIARKEDEEQFRLIEEEERQERMRKMAKKRKLGH